MHILVHQFLCLLNNFINVHLKLLILQEVGLHLLFLRLQLLAESCQIFRLDELLLHGKLRFCLQQLHLLTDIELVQTGKRLIQPLQFETSLVHVTIEALLSTRVVLDVPLYFLFFLLLLLDRVF